MEPLGRLLMLIFALISTTAAVGTPGGCQEEYPTKKLLCHIESAIHPGTNPCLCTHLVLHDTGLLNQVEKFKSQNKRLKILLKETSSDVKIRPELDGLYLKLDKPPIRNKLTDEIKSLAISIDNAESSRRAKAKYEKQSSIDDKNGIEVFMELPAEPQKLTKHYDLKALTKYINYFVVPSDNLTDSTEQGLAYHPSRLMGIDDILNADSLVDLLSGLGAEHEKLIIALPAFVLHFQLKDVKKNMPRDPVLSAPKKITQAELCKIMESGGWTLEREEDLTAPYAYKGTDWLSFDDSTSAAIKAKYVLLRNLGGISVASSENDDWSHSCTGRPLLDTIHNTFTNLARRSRAAQLLSLQDQIHNSLLPFSGEVQLSPYRIVRVVDRAGAVHVVRKEAKTEFQCSRQGYFTHPSGCNRFYRCVKFNQYSSDFTVFEYDCPAGLAFDEKYEVCVWPGSLRDGSACKGSSEIAPVPRSRFACNAEGYFADPENCRWFFACLDHQRDGITPPTAYEFRCPFGLVFDGKNLVCDWPWKVPGCGSGGTIISSGSLYPGDILEGRLRPAYAQISDSHVSGGRISGVDGGLVLGTTLLSGIADQNAGVYAAGLGGSKIGTYTFGNGNSYVGDQSGQYVHDNSGAYVHDPTGDSGGEYRHEGEYDARYSEGAGAGINTIGSGAYGARGGYGGAYDQNGFVKAVTGQANLVSGYSADGSGAYVHDSRGDTGGAYAHDGSLKTSGLGTVGSGAYVHDARGDAGGAYAHNGFVKTVGLSGGASGQGSLIGGVYTTGGSGSYVHDSRGDSGGAYVHDGSLKTSGLGTVGSGAYVHDARGDAGGAYAQNGFVKTVGISGGASSQGSLIGGASNQGSLIGGVYTTGGSGSYVHDSRGDSGGAYVHDGSLKTSGLGTVGSGAYVHDSRGDAGGAYAQNGFVKTVGISGGTSGQGSLIGGVYTAGGSGAYVHDSRGDTGGAYVQDGSLKTSGLGTVGSGAYVHDSRGDAGGAYAQNGFVKTVGISGSTSGQGSLIGGVYTAGGSGSYVHDSRGDTGGAYVQDGSLKTSGLGTVGYGAYVHDARGDAGGAYAQNGFVKTVGISGGTSGQGSLIGGVYTAGGSGAYVHDSRGDTGGAYVHDGSLKTSGLGTVGSGAYIHDARGDGTLKTSGLNIGIVGTKLVGLSGVHTGQSSRIPQLLYGGGYIQDLNDVRGVSYVQGPQGIAVGSKIPSYSYRLNNVINSGAYVHDSSGDYAVPYVHDHSGDYVGSYYGGKYTVGSGAQIKTGLYQGLNSVKYGEGAYVHDGRGDYGGGYYHAGYKTYTPVNTYGIRVNQAQLYQPISPVIHTYDTSRLNVAQPGVTVSPITVSNVPRVPLAPVQYIHSAVKPLVSVSTPSPQLIGYHYQAGVSPTVQTPVQKIQPIIVSSTPVTPTVVRTHTVTGTGPTIQPVNYGQVITQTQPEVHCTNCGVSSTVRPLTVTSSPSVISYHQPVIKTQTVRPITVSSTPIISLNPVQYVSTPSPPLYSYSTHRLSELKPVSPVVPATHSISYSHVQPAVQTQTVRPITVSSTPVVPLNPVQYGLKTVISTPATPVVNYSYKQPVIRPVQPITVSSTPAPPSVSYSYQQPVIKTQTIRPVTISSTPAPPVVSYGYKQPVQQVSIGLPSAGISYQQPVVHTQTYRPITVSSTPATPVVYKQPVQPVSFGISYQQPIVQTQTVRPITVSSTPVVPLNPVQYVHKTVVSTPAPPVIYKQPVQPVSFGISYHQPVIQTQTVRPITVSSTPVVPLNPVQYIQKTVVSTPAPPVVSYSYKQPVQPISVGVPAVGVSYQQPVIRTQTVRPIAVSSTPATPVVNYSYRQPVYQSQTVRPITVSSTPVVPLNPVQYFQKTLISTPAPPVVNYSYKQQVQPISYGSHSVGIAYQQPVFQTQTVRPISVSSTPIVPLNPVQYGQKTIVSSTPSIPVASYSYKQQVQPISFGVPSVGISYHQPVINTQTVRPITVSSTPVVPLNPVQYVQKTVVSTPAPPVVSYSYKQPVQPISVGVPAVGVSYQQPVIRTQTVRPISVTSTPATPVVSYSYKQPVQPISVGVPAVGVSYQQPVIRTQTVRPIAVSSTPATPVVSYSYKQPVQPISVGVPAVGISYQQPVIRTQTVRPFTVSSTPVVPLNPVQYVQKTVVSTPAPPVVSYSYNQAVQPISFGSPSVGIVQPVYKTQTVRPVTVTSTPAVPLNPVQYIQKTVVSTAAPPVVTYKQPVQPVRISYQQPIIKTQTVQPISISSTPIVPLNPVQYGQKTVVSSQVAPLVHHYTYNQPDLSLVNYQQSFIKTQTVRPITVSSTPAIPLNPVQYIQKVSTPAPSVVSYYSYQQPEIRTQTVRPVVTTTATPVICSSCVKSQTVRPITVTSTPAVPLNPVQYVQNTYVSTQSPPVISYTYQKPVYKTQPIQPLVSSTSVPVYQQNIAPVAVSSPGVLSYQQASFKEIGYNYPRPAVKFETPQRINTISSVPVVSTPATPVVSYSYQQPVIKTKTVTPLVSSTPIVPLNPVQYVKPIQSKPIYSYSYVKPQPLKPALVSTTATPVVSYSYQPAIRTQTIAPVTVTETPIVPLNSVQYARPFEAKKIVSIEQSQQPLIVSQAPEIVSYRQPVIKTQTVRPITVTSTPAVPLNPVQYVRPVAPKVSYSYSTPRPFTVSTTVTPSVVSYQQPIIRTQTVSPITVTSTPAVPLSPVQYVRPRPAYSFNYVKPLPEAVNTVRLPIVGYQQPVIKTQTLKPTVSTIITPSQPVVTYSQRVTTSQPVAFSYEPTVTPATVTTTDAPNRVLHYNYIKPEQKVISQPAIAVQPVVTEKPVSVGSYFEEYFEANKNQDFSGQGQYFSSSFSSEGDYGYKKPLITVPERKIVSAPVSPIIVPEVSTVKPTVNIPVESYISTGGEDENLNVNYEIQKVGLPIVTTSTTAQPLYEVTTGAPVIKKVRIQGGSGVSRGSGYYIRKQKVKVQPVITTTENYPAYFTSSTVRPVYSSTIDLTSPTLYTTTVAPSTTTLGDYNVNVQSEIDDSALIQQVSGGFGNIINAGEQGVIVKQNQQGIASTTLSSLKDGEAVVGVIKKEQEPLTGRRKTKVVVVSRLSDFNPILVGKLGAVCSCKSDAKTLDLRKGSQSQNELFRPEKPVEPSREYLPTSSTPLPDELTNFDYDGGSAPLVEIKPIQKAQRIFTTIQAPLELSTAEAPAIVSSSRRISANARNDGLDPLVDCQRPGLFRHPHLCNKFYSCNWDQWKKRFTVSVFNCPVHLAFDSQLGACNWPSKGPACSDNNLLV